MLSISGHKTFQSKIPTDERGYSDISLIQERQQFFYLLSLYQIIQGYVSIIQAG